MKKLYPPILPYNTFYLSVSKIHTIYVEESGNPKGKPVIFLHGGPGGGIEPIYRQYFNPKKWRIIIFDQRGCGQSTPHAELRENTTWDLVNDIEKISYASGTCLFTSKVIFERLENFDPFLFAYHDDLDLCWRAAMFGISSFYVPSSVIFHPIEGYSFKWSKFKFYLMERNRQYCLLTHFTKSSFLKMLPSLILVDIAVSLFYLKKGMFITKIKTSFNILKNLTKISQKYTKIQSSRTLSDKEILNIFQDKIQVPKWVVSEENSEFFNNFLNKLSKITRNFL